MRQLPVCRSKTEYRSLHSSHALRCLAANFFAKGAVSNEACISGKTLVFTIFLFQKFRPSCNQFITVKFFRLCAFDRVCGVVCQSLLPPTSVCRLRGVIGAKLAALVLSLFKKQAHIRVELRRALSIKGNRAPPLLAAGRVLHIDLENE